MYIDKDYIREQNNKLINEESISEKTFWINVMNRHQVFDREDAYDLVRSLEENDLELTEGQRKALGVAFKVFTGKTLT